MKLSLCSDGKQHSLVESPVMCSRCCTLGDTMADLRKLPCEHVARALSFESEGSTCEGDAGKKTKDNARPKVFESAKAAIRDRISDAEDELKRLELLKIMQQMKAEDDELVRLIALKEKMEKSYNGYLFQTCSDGMCHSLSTHVFPWYI